MAVLKLAKGWAPEMRSPLTIERRRPLYAVGDAVLVVLLYLLGAFAAVQALVEGGGVQAKVRRSALERVHDGG